MNNNNEMFILTSGKRYKPVGIIGKDGKPEQVGIAEYNINDVNVRARIVEYARNVGELLREHENKSAEINKNKEVDEDGLPKNIDELIALDIETTNKSIELFDKIFQEGFSKQAIGDEKNPFLLPELLELIAGEYGVKYEYEKGKYVNREQRRAKK